MATMLCKPFMGSALGARRASIAPTVAPARVSRPVSTTVVASWGRLPKIGGGRKWEHHEIGPGGRAVRIPMHIKKGDFVQVIAGKDKGKTGTIVRVLTKKGKVVVEGVNKGTKHVKPKAENEAGQIKEMEFPIHHSNVMLYSKEKGVRSRVGHKMNEAGKKVRYLIKTGEIVD